MLSGNRYFAVDNEFMLNLDLHSHREKFATVVIKGLASSILKSTAISVELIQEIFGLTSHTKNKTMIREMITGMMEKNLIEVFSDMKMTDKVSAIKNNSIYYVKADWTPPQNSFTKIYYEDVSKLVCMDEKRKDLVFAVYFNIIHRIYDSETSPDYSWVTIDTIAKETGTNEKTVMKYISLLKEHELIYYETISESSKKDKNYYCRWSDREKVSMLLKEG